MPDPKDAPEPSERWSREGVEEGKESREGEGEDRAPPRRRFGNDLLHNLLGDSSAAIRRGQGLVSGVAQGTKEELVRMISAEVRSFLDKMDAADLVQEIVSGLVIEMKTEIRFRRAEDGKLEPQVENSETKVRNEKTDKPPSDQT